MVAVLEAIAFLTLGVSWLHGLGEYELPLL
jgi:hypothetical protein